MRIQLLLILTFSAFVVSAQMPKDSVAIKNSDSLIQNYLTSLIDLDQIKDPFADLKEKKDSISFISKLKKLKPTGEISIGYDYGLLTGYRDTLSSRPFNVVRSQADLAVNAFGLPINISYNYSTFRNPLGVNNYFRISLDKDKMNQQIEEKKAETIGGLDDKLSEVESSKGKLSDKMRYAEVLMQKYTGDADKYKKELNKYESQLNGLNSAEVNIDTSKIINGLSDTLNRSSDKKDSLQNKYDQAYQKYEKARHLYDTLSQTYNKLKSIYDLYSNWEDQLENSKQNVEGYSGILSKDQLQNGLNDSISNRKQGFFGSIKTLDLGLCYPNTSALSNSNAPVKGLNLELQRNNWYTAITAGVMMNNLLVSADAVQNKLLYSQNLFNQFDFQEVTQKGLLLSLKSGYGQPESNHAFLGIRYLTNSKLISINSLDSSNTLIPSVGLEIDTRIQPKFLPETKIDFVYGKTSDSQKLSDGIRSNPFQSLFSEDRTHTGLLKVIQPVKKIRSEFTASIRWLDPQADVRSLGVLQPNNVRYELKSNHSINSRLKIGFNYRKDRNNVDNRKDTTIHLQIFGGKVNGKIGKKINYFFSMNYLTQSKMNDKNRVSRKGNYMYGAGIVAEYKLNDVKNNVSFNYNDYLLTDTVSTGLFRSIGIQNMTLFKEGQNTFSIAYFKSELNDLESNQSIIIGNDISIKRNRTSVTVGFKIAFSENYGRDAGFKLELTNEITKFLIWNLRVEKLVLGDFYNSYDRNRFDRFPYMINTNLIFKLN